MKIKIIDTMLIIFGALIILSCIASCKKNGSSNPPTATNAANYLVSNFAGNGNVGLVNGNGQQAEFNHPFGVTLDSTGDVFIADEGNNCIRKITPAGVVTTYAGSGLAGYADGPAQNAQFNSPDGLAFDSFGNLYVADVNNACIRKIAKDGTVTTLAGSPNLVGYLDGPGNSAQFSVPTGICVDFANIIYVADASNECIRKIDVSGYVSTIAGSPNNAGYADGTGKAAKFDNPEGCVTNEQGDIIVADVNNNRIRYVTRQGIVSTLAGNSQEGYADGTGAAAEFAGPKGVAIGLGYHYTFVADATGESIRLVSESGMVSTIAGDSLQGYIDGIGRSARFAAPSGVAVDIKFNIYVADYINNRIRKIVKQ